MKKIIFLCIGIFVFQVSFSQQKNQESPSGIVFQSGFEEGNKAIWDDWDGNPDSENQIVSDPGPFNIVGNHVIRLAVPSGERGGSDLTKVLPSHYDSLYVSWYIKYEAGFNFNAPNHGGGLFAGDRNYLGQSDYRPNGSNFASSTIEYNTTLHTTQIYAYYRGMYQDCANPNGACWGDHFPCTSDDGKTYCTKAEDRDPPIPPVLEANKWYHVEMKLKMGTPSTDSSVRNGEISLWIDGQNYGDWKDLWMRTTSNLKISILWLSLFHHDGSHSDAGVLMDNVIVSTKREELTSSLAPQHSGDLFQVYPNPTDKLVKVSLPGDNVYSVSLYDMQGRLLLSQLLSGTQGNLDIEKLEPGIYSVVAKDKRKNTIFSSRKLVCR